MYIYIFIFTFINFVYIYIYEWIKCSGVEILKEIYFIALITPAIFLLWDQ